MDSFSITAKEGAKIPNDGSLDKLKWALRDVATRVEAAGYRDNFRMPQLAGGTYLNDAQGNTLEVLIAARALVYGFARMAIDGHLPRWGITAADVDRTAEAILDLFLSGIARRASHS